MIPLYQNKSIPWRWLSVVTGKFERHFFFHFSLNHNKFLPWWQRYFAYVNLGFCHYLKTNINFQIGLNFGKWYVGLFRHY